jgi:nucleotide-sensitive chloride channel 1A
VDPIFEALSYCASLNPDPSVDDDDAFIDADSGHFETFTGDGEEELSDVGRVRSNFLNKNRFKPY